MRFIPSSSTFKIIFLSFLSGLFLGLSFPPFKFWFLAYPGIILILLIISNCTGYGQALRRGYCVMLFFNIFTLYWISSPGSKDIFIKLGGIAAVLVHPIFFLLPLIAFYHLMRIKSIFTAILFFPFVWTGFEFFHNLGQLSFPWIEFGNTETYNLNRIQYIDITGIHGITFLICLICSIIFYTIMKISDGTWKIKSSKVIINIAVVVVLIVLPNIYSSIYLNNNSNKYNLDEDKAIKTAIIQPNVDAWNKWKSGVDSVVNAYLIKLDKVSENKPDLVALHETATPYYFFSDAYFSYTEMFISFVNRTKINLLMGIPYLQYYSDSSNIPADSRTGSGSGKKYDTFNSAILLEPGKNRDEYQLYFKSKLVPISERAPYQEYLPFLKSIVKWGVGLGSWQIGKDMKVFNLTYRNNLHSKFASIICFESVYSDYVRQFVKKGAEFLIIITNDGWFGNSSGPYQHEQYAVLRAIENRKWIVRSAQTGISCFIDPLGNTYDKTSVFTEEIIYHNIMPNDEKTFYAVYGDLTGMISMYIGLAVLLVYSVIYVYKRRYIKSA